MDDDMHIYDVVGYQGGGHKLQFHDKIECIDEEEEEYICMSLHDPQEEGSSKYQEPQCRTKNSKTAVSNDEVKGSSDCHGLKDELKQMKIWLCVLSLLVVILFLMTVASLGLVAYAFYSTGSSASKSQIQTLSARVVKNTELVNHSFTLLKEQLTQETIQIQENVSDISTSLSNMVIRLENHLNVTNQEISQLITTMETRINDINVQVITLVSLQNVVSVIESRINVTSREVASLISLRSTVNDLESQLNMINAKVVYQRTVINN